MKTKTKTKWLGAALLAVAALGVKAEAAVGNPSYLNIDVTITNNLSVSVDSVRTSSVGFTWSGAATQVAGSVSTVANDSGYIAEKWELTAPANAFDSATGAAGWTIGTAAGVDTVALQAVFGASGYAGACSAGNFADANVAPALTSATQTPYTQTVLADTLLGGAGAKPDNATTNRMSAGSTRALCWKLTMPTSTSYTGIQVVPLIVTAF